MITELKVENLAIIEAVQLPLEAGFSVLTGETGAGKSLFVDAMMLALGGRADAELVRHGSSQASVTMKVAFCSTATLAAAEKLGTSLQEGALTIVREISSGRSSARVNGRPVPVSGLRELGATLVDLHGQHDHQSLLDPESHVEFLDAWAGAPADALKSRLAEKYAHLQAVRTKLDRLRRGQRDLEQRIDLLQYQLGEIEKAEIHAGESLELEARIERLRHAEKLTEAVAEALAAIEDGETNASDLAATAAKSLGRALKFDPLLGELLTPIEEAVVLLRDAGHGLRDYLESLESDPGQLDACVARLDLLKRLFRKYGEDEAAVLDFAEGCRKELEQLTFGELSEEDLVAEFDAIEQDLTSLAEELSKLRAETGLVFAEAVQGSLRELAMDRAVFEVSIRKGEMTAKGHDQVEFLFSANAGEPPKPLAKIASGGELSRVMLGIKSEMAQRSEVGVNTLIFDEVDAGLGGRAAVAVAQKLRSLAKTHQVIVISHLPQIAGQADHQFRIEKGERNGRVLTTIESVDGEERVLEIARMLAGEAITEPALDHARQLISVR